MAGKVTIGVTLHCLCVTDLSNLCTYRLKVKEMSNIPTLLMGYATLLKWMNGSRFFGTAYLSGYSVIN